MRVAFRSATPALGVGFAADAHSALVAHARVPISAVQKLVAVAIVPMVASLLAIVLASDHLARPAASAVYGAYLVAACMAIGLYWWVARPESRFGPLLIAYGVCAWLIRLQGSNDPLIYDIGVLAQAPGFVLVFYLFLSYPMGRLEPAAARWLWVVLVVETVAVFIPRVLLSPVISGGGPLDRCVPECPENVLQVASAPKLAEALGKVGTYVLLVFVVAVLVVYAMRFLSASRPQRRALTAVAATSLLFLPAYFIFNFAGSVLFLDQNTLDTLSWGLVVARVLLPLGFLVALLQSRHFATTALQTLLEKLAARPTFDQWRGMVAGALDDDALRLGYHDPHAGRFREPGGGELDPPAPPGRAWVPVERDGQPVAAMVIDESLTEDPELVRAASTATLIAVENGSLEGELRASRARTAEAGHAERRRIERDLHDGAQQHLAGLSIEIALARELAKEDPEVVARLDVLGHGLEDALGELRDLAHGIYPPVLRDFGLKAALAAAARRHTPPAALVADGIGRYPADIEAAVYFCCLEGLQNAGKHAGADAHTEVQLSGHHDELRFAVTDDGIGCDVESARPSGAGLANMRERVAALGGTLTIDSTPGRGMQLRGRIPLDARTGTRSPGNLSGSSRRPE